METHAAAVARASSLATVVTRAAPSPLIDANGEVNPLLSHTASRVPSTAHTDDTTEPPAPVPTTAASRSRSWIPQLDQRGVIVLLCYVNLINYVDRGIIPGAPESFQAFMTRTLGIPASKQSVYLGLLSTAFIAAAAVFALVFGFLAISHKPFKLIAYGLTSWVAAVVLCGVAYYADSYHLLLFARALSGIGEASFHCNAMPFINRNAPKENSTLWLGIFIASITIGSSIGYVYGSVFAASSLGWAWAFFVEALLMVPAVLCCFFCIPEELNAIPTNGKDKLGALSEGLLDPRGASLDYSAVLSDKTSRKGSTIGDEADSPCKQHPTTARSAERRFLSHWLRVFQHVPFSLVAFGHAAYTFSLASFSVFAPILLIGLGFFESETSVSLVFGSLMVVAGTVGTVVGAVAVDRLSEGNSVSPTQRCRISVDVIFYLMIGGALSGIVMMVHTSSKLWFLAWLTVTYLFMSAIGPAETVAVMEFFPESRQAMAVAANTVMILVFGDVPSPVVLGWLKDTWAPRCGTIEIAGAPRLNPACHEDHAGLTGVLWFAVLWLVWAVLLWGVAKLVLRAKPHTADREIVDTMGSPRAAL